MTEVEILSKHLNKSLLKARTKLVKRLKEEIFENKKYIKDVETDNRFVLINDGTPQRVDKQEFDKVIGPIIEKERKLAKNDPKFLEVKERIGACHVLWAITKRNLRNKHGIIWITPAEANPDIMYD